MKKIKFNDILYKRLTAQAEEAIDKGFEKLASDIEETIAESQDGGSIYSYGELQDDVNTEFWKITGQVIKYYDLKSVDATRVDQIIGELSNKLLHELEDSLNIPSNSKSPLEPKLLGEK